MSTENLSKKNVNIDVEVVVVGNSKVIYAFECKEKSYFDINAFDFEISKNDDLVNEVIKNIEIDTKHLDEFDTKNEEYKFNFQRVEIIEAVKEYTVFDSKDGKSKITKTRLSIQNHGDSKLKTYDFLSINEIFDKIDLFEEFSEVKDFERFQKVINEVADLLNCNFSGHFSTKAAWLDKIEIEEVE